MNTDKIQWHRVDRLLGGIRSSCDLESLRAQLLLAESIAGGGAIEQFDDPKFVGLESTSGKYTLELSRRAHSYHYMQYSSLS